MKNRKNIPGVFNNSGCLTIDAIKKYLSGNLGKRELMVVQQHLDTCSFCSDALEGFSGGYEIDKLDGDLTDIQNRIKVKINYKSPKIPSRTRTLIFVSMAASMALLIGLFYLNKLTRNTKEIVLADQHEKTSSGVQDSVTMKNTGTLPDVDKEIAYSEKSVQKEKIAEKPTVSRSTDFPVVADNDIVEPLMIQDEIADMKKTEVSVEPAITETKGETEQVVPLELSLNEPDRDLTLSEYESDVSVTQTRKREKSMTAMAISKPDDLTADESQEEEVFIIVERMPIFKDGDLSSFREYIQKQIKYPAQLEQDGIEGKVITSFTIDSTGTLVNPIIVRSADSLMDNEVVRVLKLSPKWTPGMQRGKPVNVQLTMPVEFRLK